MQCILCGHQMIWLVFGRWEQRKKNTDTYESAHFRSYCETMTYHTYERNDKKRDIWNTFYQANYDAACKCTLTWRFCYMHSFFRQLFKTSNPTETESVVPQNLELLWKHYEMRAKIEHDSDSMSASHRETERQRENKQTLVALLKELN